MGRGRVPISHVSPLLNNLALISVFICVIGLTCFLLIALVICCQGTYFSYLILLSIIRLMCPHDVIELFSCYPCLISQLSYFP